MPNVSYTHPLGASKKNENESSNYWSSTISFNILPMSDKKKDYWKLLR